MTTAEPVLPTQASDVDQVLEDLRSSGVAILTGVFGTDEIERARRRLDEIAAAERIAGVALHDDGRSASGELSSGANQRVLSLITKDPIFRQMATAPALVEAARRLFAASYPYPPEVVERLQLDAVLVSSVSANIARTGGHEMELHTDQGFVPPTIGIPLILNAVVPLVDFTVGNGATRVAPGSHVLDARQLVAHPPTARPVEAPAGAALLIDGRTWHGTGANRTPHPRPAVLVNYCPPWMRPFEDHDRRTVTDLAGSDAPHDRHLSELLGLRRWFVYGNTT